MARVTPSERFERELDEVLSGVDGELDPVERIGRLGARLILQQALEDEVTQFLGRARYERVSEPLTHRNGYEPRTVKTKIRKHRRYFLAGWLGLPVLMFCSWYTLGQLSESARTGDGSTLGGVFVLVTLLGTIVTNAVLMYRFARTMMERSESIGALVLAFVPIPLFGFIPIIFLLVKASKELDKLAASAPVAP
jgi:hypothetical protein